jgi:hypothetical protein
MALAEEEWRKNWIGLAAQRKLARRARIRKKRPDTSGDPSPVDLGRKLRLRPILLKVSPKP